MSGCGWSVCVNAGVWVCQYWSVGVSVLECGCVGTGSVGMLVLECGCVSTGVWVCQYWSVGVSVLECGRVNTGVWVCQYWSVGVLVLECGCVGVEDLSGCVCLYIVRRWSGYVYGRVCVHCDICSLPLITSLVEGTRGN